MSDPNPHFNPFLDPEPVPPLKEPEAKKPASGGRFVGDSGQWGQEPAECLPDPTWVDDSNPQAALAEVMDGTPEAPAVKLMDELRDNGQLIHPESGELVDPDNLDDLLEALQSARAMRDGLDEFQRSLVRRLTQMTDAAGDKKKTRRLVGSNLQLKLTMPGSHWEQSILKEAWNAYPALRDEYLKVATLSVKLTNYKKISSAMISDTKLETFIGIIEKADRPSSYAPTVTFEEKLTPGGAADE